MSVTLSPLAGAGWQFFDNNGVPLTGGLLYTYAAGTTTPLATYTTFSGTIANSNPIVLDSAGRLSNELWLTLGYGYKFVLKDANANLIGTYDNIPSNAASPFANDANSIAYEQGYTATAGAFIVGQSYLIVSVGTTNFVSIGAASNTVGVYFTATGAGSGTGTAKLSQSVQTKLQEIFSVKDFGAVGNGTTDDTNAIKAAISAAVAATQAGNSGIYGSGVYTGTAPQVFFPHGVYKVTSAISADTAQAINYLWFRGESSIIVANAGVTVFGGVGFDVRFEGLTFRSGACGISIKTNNIDTSRIDIINCEFNNQTTACIQTDNNSASTLLNIWGCKVYQDSSASDGYVGNFLSGDWINFENSWVSCSSAVAFYNAANLTLSNCVGVPGGNLNLTTGRWVDNYSVVSIDNFRFGGEGAGATFVCNYADIVVSSPIIPTQVRVRNCVAAYAAFYAIKFFKLPNIFEFIDNAGLIDNDGFYFDTALTQADFLNWQYYGQITVDRNYGVSGLTSSQTTANGKIGNAVMLASLTRANIVPASILDRLTESQIYGSGAHGGGWSSAGTAGLAFVTNIYGVQEAVFTAAADYQSVSYYLNTYLNYAVLPSNNTYTLIAEFTSTVAKNDIPVTIAIGGAIKTIQVQKGKTIICVPFVYLNNTGSANTPYDQIAFNTGAVLLNGETLTLGRHIVLQGNFNWPYQVINLSGTVAPTGYTNGIGYNSGYYRGDISYNANVASAGYIGYVCTVAGTPGTWKTFGLVS